MATEVLILELLVVLVVGIHDGPWGNKVDGLFGLSDLNKKNKSNSWPGPQNKVKTTNKTSGEVKQVEQGVLGC